VSTGYYNVFVFGMEAGKLVTKAAFFDNR